MAPKPQSLFSTPVEKIISRHPAFLPTAGFLAMLLSNSLLSYLSFSTTLKLFVVFFGVFLPFLLVVIAPQSLKNPKAQESLFSIPPWIWAALALAAFGLRFFRLSTLSSWPIVDEGVYGYFATLLEEKWDWRLVHGFAQLPTLYIWGMSLCFKIFGNSLMSLWLFPAICSLLCVPAAWLAARKVFGGFIGFVAVCWSALGFWPLYMGRFSTQNILMVFWECLTFYALARCLDEPKSLSRSSRLIFLGILTGVGFYIYLGWPFVALAVVLALFLNPYKPGWTRLKAGLFVLLISIVTALPLALDFTSDYQGYFHHLWVGGSPAVWSSRFLLPMDYVKGRFWEPSRTAFSYGPLWGGLFNPLLSSLIFLGLASLLRTYRKPVSQFLLGALLLFFLPAALTNNFEMMRLAALLPVLIAIAALGTHFLLFSIQRSKRIFLFSSIVLASLFLDFRHLFLVYPASRAGNQPALGAYKTLEFEEAYSFLKPTAEAQGPGLIYLNFHPDPYDQTLFVATYPFNASENPRLKPSEAKWAAILTNIHEEPYLKKIFPDGKWTWLSDGLRRTDGGLMLEIVPISQANKNLLMKWANANQSLKELTRLVMEFGVNPDQNQMLGVLDKAYPLFQNDRLLESRYWRIRALHLFAAGRNAEGIENEKKAIELGYPMADLYNEEGCFLFKETRRDEAKKAFKKAIGLKPNCTDAAANLQVLDQM